MLAPSFQGPSTNSAYNIASIYLGTEAPETEKTLLSFKPSTHQQDAGLIEHITK
jgi:hypothetical protein